MKKTKLLCYLSVKLKKLHQLYAAINKLSAILVSASKINIYNYYESIVANATMDIFYFGGILPIKTAPTESRY